MFFKDVPLESGQSSSSSSVSFSREEAVYRVCSLQERNVSIPRSTDLFFIHSLSSDHPDQTIMTRSQ